MVPIFPHHQPREIKHEILKKPCPERCIVEQPLPRKEGIQPSSHCVQYRQEACLESFEFPAPAVKETLHTCIFAAEASQLGEGVLLAEDEEEPVAVSSEGGVWGWQIYHKGWFSISNRFKKVSLASYIGASSELSREHRMHC